MSDPIEELTASHLVELTPVFHNAAFQMFRIEIPVERKCRREPGTSRGNGNQWRKWRIPVKTMAMSRRSAAAITSASFTEPPG